MGKNNLKIHCKFLIIVILIILSCSTIPNNKRISNNLGTPENTENLKNSGLWVKLTLLNTEVNDTNHYHNDTIPIEGRLTEYLDDTQGINDYNVCLYVNGIKMSQFDNKTHIENTKDGYFNITFIIPFNLSIYQTHKIEVNVTDDLGYNFVELQNFYVTHLFPKYKLNLTNNYEVNNTTHYHNDTISIKGSIYEYFNNISYPNTDLGVSIYIDGLKYDFNNLTYDKSNFTIEFEIPFNLSLYQSHLIEAGISQGVWENDVERENNFTINLFPYINLTLTNPEIQNTQHYHNEVIAIQGKASEFLNYTKGLSGHLISLYIDGQLESGFTDTTGQDGTFQINYLIPFDLNINQTHTVEVDIIQGPWVNDVVPQNSFTISLVPYVRINLTNYAINNSYYFQNGIIDIRGKVYEYLDYSKGIRDQNVSLYIDGQLQSAFRATTDPNGEFQINYTIPTNFRIYKAYKIEVNLTQGIFINESVLDNYFNFYVKADSDLELTHIDSLLKLPGEVFRIEGSLKYINYLPETGIQNQYIEYFWYNSSFKWPVNSFYTSDGSFSENLRIPTNVFSSWINLNISFPGDFPHIGPSDLIITNITLFSNINCIWDVNSKALEGENFTISGQIVSSPNSLPIYNRSLRILYNGIQIKAVNTDQNGEFEYIYGIPTGPGNNTILVELVNTAGVTLDSFTIINVSIIPFVPSPTDIIPPFLIFSLVFFPILIGIIAVLGVFGYRYYKKQEKKSRVVTVQLDPRFLNLKILKDSGRLEESLSYLFNAIFMRLIEAKYNRTRKENETIRDFAIISVKELKLTPAAIYPFIQKVEAIIYGKPFNITENDFYKTCELFSPLYFELTGNNFILNF